MASYTIGIERFTGSLAGREVEPVPVRVTLAYRRRHVQVRLGQAGRDLPWRRLPLQRRRRLPIRARTIRIAPLTAISAASQLDGLATVLGDTGRAS